jgi:hypothetical protein
VRFFCYTPDGFELYDSAEAAKTAAEAGLELWTDGEFVEGHESICWGEVRGGVRVDVVHVHGEECKGENGCPEGHPGVGEWDYVGDASIVDVPAIPDPEVERLRAELADLRARVGAAIAAIREMEAHHRQGVRSPAHGGYSFERAGGEE